jgi:hypothetical protein
MNFGATFYVFKIEMKKVLLVAPLTVAFCSLGQASYFRLPLHSPSWFGPAAALVTIAAAFITLSGNTTRNILTTTPLAAITAAADIAIDDLTETITTATTTTDTVATVVATTIERGLKSYSTIVATWAPTRTRSGNSQPDPVRCGSVFAPRFF